MHRLPQAAAVLSRQPVREPRGVPAGAREPAALGWQETSPPSFARWDDGLPLDLKKRFADTPPPSLLGEAMICH